jgi:hypothetical protein
MVDAAPGALPGESSVSRWRFLLDYAMMQIERDDLQAKVRDGKSSVRYLMADSSMQHGRDFEHIIVRQIPTESLATLLRTANTLRDLWLPLVSFMEAAISTIRIHKLKFWASAQISLCVRLCENDIVFVFEHVSSSGAGRPFGFVLRAREVVGI